MQSTKLHIAGLTSVRGLAALWVVIFHFWSEVIQLFPGLDWLSPFARYGLYAVPLFFVLSGYVISANYFTYLQSLNWQRYRLFMVKRLRRIYPVHLAGLLVVLAFAVVAWLRHIHLDETGYTLPTFVQHLFLVQSWVPHMLLSWNFPAWSISSEFFAYLIFPLTVGLLGRLMATSAQQLAMLVLCCLASMAIYSMYEGPFMEVLVVIPTFFGGVAIYRWLDGLETTSKDFSVLSYLLLIAILAVPYLFTGLWVPRVLIVLFFALILTLSASGPRSNFWSQPWMMYLGEISYSLYMSHAIALKLLHALLPASRFAASSLVLRLAMVTVYILTVAAAALVCYYLVERRFHSSRTRPGAALQAVPVG